MSLATQARERLLGVRQARSSNSANLWNLKSPLADSAVTLSGDLSMLLFYYCEGDPAVRHAEYAGPAVHIRSGQTMAVADALVEIGDGSTQVRVIDSESPGATSNIASLRASCGHALKPVSVTELLDASLRIRNWKSAISAFHRCDATDLVPVLDQVLSYVSRHNVTNLASLIQHCNLHHPLHVVGAAVLGLRMRSINSNMDSAPWCMYTRLMRLDHGEKY